MEYLIDTIKKLVGEGELKTIGKELFLKVSNFIWEKKYSPFSEFFINKEWREAIESGELILGRKSLDSQFYQKLSISYGKVHKYDQAEYYMRKSLEMKIEHSIEGIISIVEKNIFLAEKNLISRYINLGGINNLGFIEHELKEKTQKVRFLTKIVSKDYPMNFFGDKEDYFHRVICKKYPRLKSITPEMINSFKLKEDKLSFLTFNKVRDNRIDISNLKDIINTNKTIENSISYSEAREILNITDKGRANSLSSTMHKNSTNKLILNKMRESAGIFKNNFNLDTLINRIEYIIINLKLYKKIIPEKHYVFCHGDLNKKNLLYDEIINKYYIIDWNFYGLALKGYDLSDIFADYGLTFEEIEKNYIEFIFEEEEDAVLNKLFFAYNLLIHWIGKLDENKIEKEINTCILPAIEYMESLSAYVQGGLNII